jgi:lysozyme family protein
MADPNIAIPITLINEDGYNNDPNDSGGATKYGITQRDVDRWLPGTNVKDLTETQAMDYYRNQPAPGMRIPFWNRLYDEINDQNMANKLFDLGVLFGIGEAVVILQHALEVAVDHNFGPATLAAVNAADPRTLLTAYKSAFVTYALHIGSVNPKNREFVAGWIRRINL